MRVRDNKKGPPTRATTSEEIIPKSCELGPTLISAGQRTIFISVGFKAIYLVVYKE